MIEREIRIILNFEMSDLRMIWECLLPIPLPSHKHEVTDLQRNLKSLRLSFQLALMLFKFKTSGTSPLSSLYLTDLDSRKKDILPHLNTLEKECVFEN